MSNHSQILSLSELQCKETVPGARGRFVHTKNMTLAYWEFEAGLALPEHTHLHEQITHVLDGVFEMTIEGETHRLEAGMVAVIPSNARHAGKAITNGQLADVFHPVREDFR